MEEVPTPERVLAGEGMYYDAEGNSCAVCLCCGGTIDLQHDVHYEMGLVRRLGVVAEGQRWFWHEWCQKSVSLPIS